jgi:hypothetical protein
MSWNYRIVRKDYSSDLTLLPTYQIHECYYEDDQKSIRFVTENPINPWGETLDELKENMHQMAEAFHKPVIEWEEEWNDE